MEELYLRLVERLLDNPRALSRNRNFHLFDDPDARRAARLFARLTALARGVVRATEEGGEIILQRRGDGFQLDLQFPQSHGSQTAWLKVREFSLLLRTPALRGRIPAVLQAAS